MGGFDLGRAGTVQRCFQRQDGQWTVTVKSGKNEYQLVHSQQLDPGKSVKLVRGRHGMRIG